MAKKTAPPKVTLPPAEIVDENAVPKYFDSAPAEMKTEGPKGAEFVTEGKSIPAPKESAPSPSRTGEGIASATSSSEPSKAAEMLAEADEDDERTAAIRQAARDGWNAFAQSDFTHPFASEDEVGTKRWSDLNPLEQFGLLSHVQSIVNDPYQDTFAKVMPHGHHHRAHKALDNELRKALGFAEVSHV